MCPGVPTLGHWWSTDQKEESCCPYVARGWKGNFSDGPVCQSMGLRQQALSGTAWFKLSLSKISRQPCWSGKVRGRSEARCGSPAPGDG